MSAYTTVSHSCLPLHLSRAVSLYGLSHTPRDVSFLSLPRRLCPRYSLFSIFRLLPGVPLRGMAMYVTKMNDKRTLVLQYD